MTAPAPAVMLDGATVRHLRRPAPLLQDVSLVVAPGEHVLVLGPSGSGKSTLLRVVSGVVPHTVSAELEGTASVVGRRTEDTGVVELSRHVGVLAQDPGSSVCLPVVEQELALPLENRAVDPATIDGRIDAALAAVGAAGLRRRRTAELSGGEVQRVAFAATVVAEPDVLLLDEPTSMLDPAGVASVRAALDSALGSSRGRTRGGPAVLLVEHRLDDLAGDRGLTGLPARTIALSTDGRVLADGPTEMVLHETAAELVAAGCWLPLEVELAALTGHRGGLGSSVVADALRHVAATAPAEVATSPGEPVLRARGLAVRPGGERPRRRWSRRRREDDRRTARETALLRDVDLDVRAGEVVAVLGANGTGKSSLLLTLAGLLPQAAGEVVGPRPGLVFQDAERQLVATSVRAEVAAGLPEGAARDARVEAALAEHRLAHLADADPHRLSGGELRRLSVAAMLVHDRPCLLVDEPTLGLDRRAVTDLVRALRRTAAAGRGVVVVSHDLRTVAALADRVVVLGDGGVVADGLLVDVLREGDVLRRGGLVLPALVRGLLAEGLDGEGVRAVLAALDAPVASASTPDGAVAVAP